MHACDWFATLATATASKLDQNSTLASDSVDMWEALSNSGSAAYSNSGGADAVAGADGDGDGTGGAGGAGGAWRVGATVYPRTTLVHHVELKHKKPIGKIRFGEWNFYIGDPGAASGWPRPGDPEPDFPGNCTAPPYCLFHVGGGPVHSKDIGEHHNMASTEPELVANLTAMLKAAACSDCVADELPNTSTATTCDGIHAFGAVSPYIDL